MMPVLLLLIIAGYFLLFSSKKGNSRHDLVQTANNGSAPLQFTLEDSTVVTLEPNSTLKYPAHFTNNERNVYLEGEGGFHVKRNEHSPFKVYAENLVTTVLGTIFKIERSGDSALTVHLEKGKLNVGINNSSADPILLAPGESAVYVRKNENLYKKVVIPESSLSFRQNDFQEIAGRIKKEFGITVINLSNKKKWRFTGEFRNKSVKEIIESICEVEGLKSESQGDTILIK